VAIRELAEDPAADRVRRNLADRRGTGSQKLATTSVTVGPVGRHRPPRQPCPAASAPQREPSAVVAWPAERAIADRAAAATALGPIIVALLLLAAAFAAHRALDRRRMAAWEADWSQTEPHWTRRR